MSLCLLAPVYAKHVAHTGPNDNHVTDKVRGGKTDVVGPTGSGRPGTASSSSAPTPTGRDVAVRLLYGGRNSLEIGASRR